MKKSEKKLTGDILSCDIVDILELYNKEQLTPSKLVEIFIEQQQNINEQLNLVVEDRYTQARKEAKDYDNILKTQIGKFPLFGIPISMKESFNVENLHTTGGLKHRKNFIAKKDAPVVKKLKEAGAIILDKTNTPTLCFCQETDNLLFGRSNNPWNTKYTTGGSSGGEAALIAVGGAVAGFGSDIGGSIRIPAHFNGVVGFKPGHSTFNGDGHLPSKSTECQKIMLGYGPLTKSVRDARKIYEVISDYPIKAKDLKLEELNLYHMCNFNKIKCCKETQALFEKILNTLESKMQTEKYIPPFMNKVSDNWKNVMAEDKANFIFEDAYPKQKHGHYADYFKSKIGLKGTNHKFLAFGLIGTSLFAPSKEKMLKVKAEQKEWTSTIEKKLKGNGIILMPTYPHPAKKHGKIYSEIFNLSGGYKKTMPFTAFANFLGLPALTMPVGFSKKGLPISIQIISSKGNEDVIFKVGEFLESQGFKYSRNSSYDR
ncbi:MAG: amidase [Spirochaetales bacterium]|nr:amidase [Spirochaetales bacterium]